MSNSPASDNIDETNNMITELYPELQCNDVNNIIGNPGFPSINQNILFCLDNDSQLAFKQVCRSWMEQVNQPIFLIKKLNLAEKICIRLINAIELNNFTLLDRYFGGLTKEKIYIVHSKVHFFQAKHLNF